MRIYFIKLSNEGDEFEFFNTKLEKFAARTMKQSVIQDYIP